MAMEKGYDAIKQMQEEAELNSAIVAAIEMADEKIGEEMSAGKKVSTTRKNAIFIETCSQVAISIANAYGRQEGHPKLSPEETALVFQQMITNNSFLMNQAFKGQCVAYDVACFDSTELGAYIDEAADQQKNDSKAHPNKGDLTTTTTPFYAALAGEYARGEAGKKLAQKYNADKVQ